ncbi:MAG: Laminin-binding fimbrial subunit ElfA [Luteibacter sp.]|uniref:fimbrial protein n=1 Tax=Luteibacter sp. TaxID=1886636 RepID=UPI00137FAB25|nr:fimbrial protein [Luteibacter sp.]KAF1008056.1 MAG: Laminin-binding fimbrial subunit ElfA [Luteibacter sp.]
MIHRTLTLALATAIAGLATAPAMAQNSSTITLTGRVTAGTCTVTNPTITMPDVSAKDMTAPGRIVASNTPLTIQLSGCSGVTGARLTFGGTADRDTDVTTVFKNKATTGAAPHTAIWLGHTSCTTSSNDLSPGATRDHTFTSGTFSIPLCAAYYAKSTGVVKAGTFSSTFNVLITYQ